MIRPPAIAASGGATARPPNVCFPAVTQPASTADTERAIADRHVKLSDAIRAHHRRNRLNGARRPKSRLSGLVVCGCCGGPYALRSVDRFACSSHTSNGACSNRRTIAPSSGC
ncbi:hypothetical protein M2281_005198 [Mesorhizobium soli]|uniref:zinc ribbon domain-containing protein n=1 Tax=Pseudaminobacter soli (ex Li et al. 2025) TaxID=1295366 RepID=UPI002472E83A|nr:zinc ribbon domain-containing protein [Mesorhizobium soli]MDH6234580.1 hypothetical protein [Mesorhizobium soli]